MWRLLDIGYVMPATIILAYFLGKVLSDQLGGDYMAVCIITGAILGLILTFYRIKKYIDSEEAKESQENI